MYRGAIPLGYTCQFSWGVLLYTLLSSHDAGEAAQSQSTKMLYPPAVSVSSDVSAVHCTVISAVPQCEYCIGSAVEVCCTCRMYSRRRVQLYMSAHMSVVHMVLYLDVQRCQLT